MKKLKRAFTIVELVIVIAVIAILAAVLIPTFTSLIEKANESSDTVLAKNMNTILSTTDYEEDKSDRMTDTLYLLNENGYSLENMNPTADGNVFVWDSAANRIVYLDKEGTVIYSENKAYKDVDSMVANAKGYLWVTVGSVDEIEKWSKLDLYFSSDIGNTDTELNLADSSLDTSAFKFLGKVKYGESTRNVSVYGSVAEMEIDSPEATVTNYSRAGTVTINRIADHSYHENGSVDTLIVAGTATNANVVIEERGIVQNIKVDSSAASVVNKGYILEIDPQSQAEVTNQGGYIKNGNGKANGDENPAEGYVLSIDSYKELALFRDSVNNGTTYNGMTVALTADIDISGWAWVPIGVTDRNVIKDNPEKGAVAVFQGIFDGQGHTITGLSNTGFDITELDPGKNDTTPSQYSEVVYGFFGSIYGATIKNVKLSNVNINLSYNTDDRLLGDSIGALVGFAYSDDDAVPVVIENCQVVSGKVQGYDAVGGIMGRFYNGVKAGKMRVSNCSNAAEVVAYRRASGVVGYLKTYVQIIDCTNSADVTSLPYNSDPEKAVTGDDETPNMSYYFAAGIACTYSNHNLVLTNCSNTGVITAELYIGGDTSKPRNNVCASQLANLVGADYAA